MFDSFDEDDRRIEERSGDCISSDDDDDDPVYIWVWVWVWRWLDIYIYIYIPANNFISELPIHR